MNKKGFSFIEIIIVVTIVSLLAVIGVGITSNSQEKSMNSKALADLETLKGNFDSYRSESGQLPLPLGNINFYDDEGGYMHSESGSYGVSGSVRENILPKKYVNILPVDPRTGQYYGYGKDFTNNHFEVAGVLYDGGSYISKVIGDYDGKDGIPNLVREYNGTNFVFEGSTDIYPYNPEKKAMNAKIISSSGAINVNGSTLPISNISSTILVSGDTVSVGTGGLAQIAFSDGSVSTLGDSNTSSEMTLAYMEYKNDTFFTKVSIALKVGTIWTQATKLDSKSEFQVSTSDTTASVRGTIFGVSRDATGNTKVNVTVGKVLVAKIIDNKTYEQVTHTLEQNTPLETTPIVVTGVTTTGEENGNPTSYVEVLEGSTSKGIEVGLNDGGVIITNSGSISEPVNDTAWNNGITLKVINVQRGLDNQLTGVTFKRNKHFLVTDKLIINDTPFASGETIGSFINNTFTKNIGRISGEINTVRFKVCRSETQCTRSVTIPYRLGQTTGGLVNTGSLVDTTGEKTCNGIKIREKCMKNELTASGWTLVAAADYTQANSNLYTYNGGKISGNYDSNTGFSTDGYQPKLATGSGIVYKNINTFLGDGSYTIEVKVDGYTLANSTGSQYIFSSNNFGLYYDGGSSTSSSKKIGIYRPSSSSPLSGEFLPYTILSETSYNIFLVQKVNSPVSAMINNSSQEALVSLNPEISVSLGDSFYLGKKFSNTFPWRGTIKSLKIYKKTSTPTSSEINTSNQISLKKTLLIPTLTSSKINGMCGLSNGQTYSSLSQIDVSKLCGHGNPDNFIEGTNYTWSCLGINGGTDISCSANRQISQVSGYGCGSCPYGTYNNGESCGGFNIGPEITRCSNISGGNTKCRKRYGPGCLGSDDDYNWSGTPINIPVRPMNIVRVGSTLELQMEAY